MGMLHCRINIFLFYTKCDRVSYFPVCMAFGEKDNINGKQFYSFPISNAIFICAFVDVLYLSDIFYIAGWACRYI